MAVAKKTTVKKTALEIVQDNVGTIVAALRQHNLKLQDELDDIIDRKSELDEQYDIVSEAIDSLDSVIRNLEHV